jgi:carbonic anhydrase
MSRSSGQHLPIGGTRYELLQFHLHCPSEHLLTGKAFELECHLVHRSSAGALAVIGIFVRPGAHNATLAPVFDAMPTQEGPENREWGGRTRGFFLPASRVFFRYAGSLTTPPCSEGLVWTVFKEPIDASPAQIREFAASFKNNARPVQKLNSRILVVSS